MARYKSPASPAGKSAATKYAKEIRPGVWQYTSGPSKGRFAPTRNGLPFLPGWRKDKAGRAYNVKERQERAKRTIQVPTPRGRTPSSKASYARRFGISPLGGIPTVYAPVPDQIDIEALQQERGLPYWDDLLSWARSTFPKGPLENGRGWVIVGQAGKASHWRSYTAQWSFEVLEGSNKAVGWHILGSAITQPDVSKAVDSGSRLKISYDNQQGLPGPDERAKPSIALSIPVKRIKPSRWDNLTSK